MNTTWQCPHLETAATPRIELLGPDEEPVLAGVVPRAGSAGEHLAVCVDAWLRDALAVVDTGAGSDRSAALRSVRELLRHIHPTVRQALDEDPTAAATILAILDAWAHLGLVIDGGVHAQDLAASLDPDRCDVLIALAAAGAPDPGSGPVELLHQRGRSPCGHYVLDRRLTGYARAVAHHHVGAVIDPTVAPAERLASFLATADLEMHNSTSLGIGHLEHCIAPVLVELIAAGTVNEHNIDAVGHAVSDLAFDESMIDDSYGGWSFNGEPVLAVFDLLDAAIQTHAPHLTEPWGAATKAAWRNARDNRIERDGDLPRRQIPMPWGRVEGRPVRRPPHRRAVGRPQQVAAPTPPPRPDPAQAARHHAWTNRCTHLDPARLSDPQNADLDAIFDPVRSPDRRIRSLTRHQSTVKGPTVPDQVGHFVTCIGPAIADLLAQTPPDAAAKGGLDLNMAHAVRLGGTADTSAWDQALALLDTLDATVTGATDAPSASWWGLATKDTWEAATTHASADHPVRLRGTRHVPEVPDVPGPPEH